MKLRTRKILMLVSIMLLMLGVYVFFVASSNKSVIVSAKKGITHLKDWDWSKNRIIKLEGEWRYYPNILRSELNDQKKYIFKKVPHYWEEDFEQKFSPYGYGLYQMKIIGLKPSELYGISMPDEVSAYVLYANEKKIAENGVPGKNKESYIPNWRPLITVFQADEYGNAVFTIGISNFDYYRGGFWNSIKLGTVGDVINEVNRARSLELIIFAIIFIIGFFNLSYYIIYKNDRTALYFALFCFTMSIQTIQCGHRIIMDLLPGIQWDLLIRLEFLLGYLLLPLFGLFIVHLFESENITKHLKYFFYLYIPCCFAGIFMLPNALYAKFIEPYKWLSVLFGLCFVFLIGKAIKERHESLELMLFGSVGMIAAIIQEIFIRGPVSWLPFASLNFVICFSLVTLQQFLRIVRRGEILETKVVLDPLTGVYNRNFLMKLDEFYFNADSEKMKTYMLFLDLDKFKYINDTFGHKIGDFILQETSLRFKKLLREDDIICRYGGDEFIAIIMVESALEIVKIAERIIQEITHPFEKGGSSYKIGISIGIAEKTADTKNTESLIKKSDAAMYQSKKKGGNRYTFAD